MSEAAAAGTTCVGGVIGPARVPLITGKYNNPLDGSRILWSSRDSEHVCDTLIRLDGGSGWSGEGGGGGGGDWALISQSATCCKRWTNTKKRGLRSLISLGT